MFRHLDLFSGIGGFALAAQEVWGNDYECIGFCDNNKFCQEVLKARWPNVRIFGDIRGLTANTTGQRCGEREQDNNGQMQDEASNGPSEGDEKNIDLLTGGFPCQPFSHAGKRRGRSDDRFLWPEMLRVIKEFKPRWVIAENVRGILSIEGGLVFEQVCLGLEKEGYAVRAFIIPACAVGAPHRRDRVWIVAHRTRDVSDRPYGEGWRSGGVGDVGKASPRGTDTTADAPQDAVSLRSRGRKQKLHLRRQEDGHQVQTEGPDSVHPDSDAPDGDRKGLEGHGSDEECGRERAFRKGDWQEDWREIALATCDVRMDDGLPVELDGFKLSKAGHRVERLKALGNAIVPAVAVEIMKAIKEADEG